MSNEYGYIERVTAGFASRVWFLRFTFYVVIAVGVLNGCDSSVDPIIGSDLPFTIWGFMNSGADTQYVRVFPITGKLITERGDEIDAEVYSTDMTTSERCRWMYKLVHLDSVSTGHVFWSPFRAEQEHRYRLEVIRSDGATSSAEVTVPSDVDFQLEMVDGSLTFPVRILGDIPNLVGPRVTYQAINIPPPSRPTQPLFPPVVHAVTVPYDETAMPIDGGWRFDINMVRDTAAVFDEFRAACLINGTETVRPSTSSTTRSPSVNLTLCASGCTSTANVLIPRLQKLVSMLLNYRLLG